jgi:hypothetical protein
MLVRTGPSCTLAHSRLILSLPSAGGLLIHAFTLSPTSAVWPGYPNLGAWLGIYGYKYVHTLLWNGLPYIHSKTGNMHMSAINHIDHAIGKGQTDLLFLTPSVRHNSKAF